MDKVTKETVEIFDDAAERYQEKYMDVSSYAVGLSYFCESLESPTSYILDVACGPGNVAKFLLDKMPDISILASDLSLKMIELTKINVPKAETMLLDAKEINAVDKLFDGVVASFIFPYLSKGEVSTFVEDSRAILNLGGLLYISTMQGMNSDSGYIGPSDGIRMFMNYHEVDYLEKTLLDGGFEVIYSVLQPYDYGEDNCGTDIIMIGKVKP